MNTIRISITHDLFFIGNYHITINFPKGPEQEADFNTEEEVNDYIEWIKNLFDNHEVVIDRINIDYAE